MQPLPGNSFLLAAPDGEKPDSKFAVRLSNDRCLPWVH